MSLRNAPLLAERGIDISHETVPFWWVSFGRMCSPRRSARGVSCTCAPLLRGRQSRPRTPRVTDAKDLSFELLPVALDQFGLLGLTLFRDYRNEIEQGCWKPRAFHRG